MSKRASSVSVIATGRGIEKPSLRLCFTTYDSAMTSGPWMTKKVHHFPSGAELSRYLQHSEHSGPQLQSWKLLFRFTVGAYSPFNDECNTADARQDYLEIALAQQSIGVSKADRGKAGAYHKNISCITPLTTKAAMTPSRLRALLKRKGALDPMRRPARVHF